MMGGRHAGPSETEARAFAAMRRQAKAMRKAGLPPDQDALDLIRKVAEEKLWYRRQAFLRGSFGIC